MRVGGRVGMKEVREPGTKLPMPGKEGPHQYKTGADAILVR